MKKSIQECKALLRKAGLKSTVTRIAVLQHLWLEDRPMSHSDLVQTLEQVGDQATIYRTLVSFVDKGIARIASNVTGIVRYEIVEEGEGAHTIHPHFVCQDCGVVTCLPTSTVITTIDPSWKERLQHSKLQFLGTCAECELP
tara:strand:+ start:140 stop:565 length:426 start_codon:yes stop_codon:yes gene_type:complete